MATKLINEEQPRKANSLLGSKKHQKLTEITYANNKNSNYTEKIENLESSFSYESERHYYWGPAELSIFYGTPLYEQASPSQKLALNHLYWVTQYNQTAATEANAILYNQVTEGLFSALGGFDTLCEELFLETAQEHHHIHAFHSVAYKTKKSLLGIGKIKNFRPRIKSKSDKYTNWYQVQRLSLPFKLSNHNWEIFQENALHLINHQLFGNKATRTYSDYLKKLQTEGEPLPVQTTGLLGQVVPLSFSKLMILNFGSSPFLACFYYVTRYLANLLLKNYEYQYLKFYRELVREEKYTPVPTAISHYHLLDESFHTTISQLIACDLYKEFPRPTIYERTVANTMLYRIQTLMLSGLSGVMPATFRNDSIFIEPLYNILRSSLFEMPHDDAIYWLEKCLCHEHEGFQINLKYHQRLCNNVIQAFQPLNYLWRVNRELGLMKPENSLVRILKNNRISLLEFTRIYATNDS